MSQTEKQVMDGLVAKVREVVHDVSNNDIILVLHNYEMDVQKAIQALCEDRENALGTWEHTGATATKKKNQKKKAKRAAKVAVAETSSSNGGASPSSSTPVSTPTPVAVSKPPAAKTVAPAPRVPEPVPKVEKKSANADANEHSANLEQVASSFDDQVSRAEQQLRSIFDYVRECVDNREKELQKELRRCRSDGTQFVSTRRNQMTNNLSEFVAGLPAQAAFAEAERFFYDAAPVLDTLRALGEVVPVTKASSSSASKPAVPVAVSKKAPEQPAANGVVKAPKAAAPAPAPEPEAPKKEAPTSVVNNGGFVMGSDGLSADQLAAIHASLQANLQAQGVDLSVVEDMNNGGFVAPRRRPNNGNNANGGKANGRGSRPMKV